MLMELKMTNEATLIMRRRFTGRVLESGLLIIAVALGVGAASSGLSLFFHTNEYSKSILSSPEYREVVVTTRGNMEDMEAPALELSSKEEIKLTTSDLSPGELIPTVSFSYVTNRRRLSFVNDDMIRKFNSNAGGDNINDMFDSYDSVKDNPDYITPEVDQISGLEISSQFFNAWNLVSEYGSLFTNKDFQSNNRYLVLGANVAKQILPKDYKISDLIDKKIISWSTSYTIVGILEETGLEYDDYYFTPIKESSNERFFGVPGGNDQQLRFSVFEPDKLDSTVKMLEGWFNKKYGEGLVVISNPREEAQRLVDRNNGISILILFLSIAGLFIASVNVSNILISRSIRMKKHVGILKALGASKKSIIKLFAFEGFIITLAGSILGTGLAIPLSFVMQKSLGLGDISWLYIGVGVLLSSVLTLLFSIIPARSNSRIEAAVAMRSAG